MKKASLLLLIFFSLIALNCENEPLDAGVEEAIITNNPTNPNDPTNPIPGGGNSTGDYWPMAAGNKWIYSNTIDGVAQEDYTMEIAGLENYQGNPNYLYDQFFSATQGTDGTQLEDLSVPTYSRKDNGDYYISVAEFTAEVSGLFEISQTGFGYIILKDYLPVGSTWSQDYSTTTTTTVLVQGSPAIPPTTLNNEVDIEIMEKDATVEVNGTSYDSVIKVRFLMSTTTPGFATASTIDYIYSFAKDVGIVKIEGTVNDVDSGIVTVILYELNSFELF